MVCKLLHLPSLVYIQAHFRHALHFQAGHQTARAFSQISQSPPHRHGSGRRRGQDSLCHSLRELPGQQSRTCRALRWQKGSLKFDADNLLTGQSQVVIFGVPGAFTPGCSKTHLPGYVEAAADMKAKGVNEIVCVSVNDPFVMEAWGKDQAADGKVEET